MPDSLVLRGTDNALQIGGFGFSDAESPEPHREGLLKLSGEGGAGQEVQVPVVLLQPQQLGREEQLALQVRYLRPYAGVVRLASYSMVSAIFRCVS